MTRLRVLAILIPLLVLAACDRPANDPAPVAAQAPPAPVAAPPVTAPPAPESSVAPSAQVQVKVAR